MALASSLKLAFKYPCCSYDRLSNTNLYFEVDVPICGCPTNRVQTMANSLSIHSTLQQGGQLKEVQKHLARCFVLLLFRERSNFLVAMIFPRNYERRDNINFVPSDRFFKICMQ